MAHPFFDATTYPWHLPEATRLHVMLYTTYNVPARIETLYKQCQAGLLPLALGAAPDVIWREALTNLTSAGALRRLCEIVQGEPHLQNNVQIQSVIREVLNAQPSIDRLIISNDVIVLDRRTLRQQLSLLESDANSVKVVLVRGDPRSGKSYGRWLFRSCARDRGAQYVYLSADLVATVDEVFLAVFSALGAAGEIPTQLTTEDAWYKSVCYKLQNVLEQKASTQPGAKPLWIAVDDLGPGPDGGPLLDQRIRKFFEQFVLMMQNDAFSKWFRLLLIHYPDGPVPTQWEHEYWTEDRTSASDIQEEHVVNLLREWKLTHDRMLLDDELTGLAKRVIEQTETTLAQGPGDASRPQLIHDALIEIVRNL